MAVSLKLGGERVLKTDRSELLRLDRVLWRRGARAEIRQRKIWAAVAESAAAVLLATVIYFLLIECGVRIAIHSSLFRLTDFRHERGAKTINQAVEYDSQLGWRLKSFMNWPRMRRRARSLPPSSTNT
jgi:hypothetical protein